MLVDDLSDLAGTLEQQINERTGRRIRALRVDVGPERVIVSGIAPSYYLKQLVWMAVQKHLGTGQPRVLLDIDVCGSGARAAEGHDRLVLSD